VDVLGHGLPVRAVAIRGRSGRAPEARPLRRVTTKRPHLELIDELASRIREASRFVPLERLAVSPQCGFSNSVMGNAISLADQERKLRLVVETTRRVWGEDTAMLSSS